MDFRKNILYFSLFCLTFLSANAQEGLPIYSDYLTDNYYLLYPSMAGVSNCGKVRVTGRQQWFDHEKAPQLQTISVNTRIGDSRSAIGAIVFNDMNGYHSQTGAYLTYAHHILFSRSELDLDMLSFGISAGMIQYKLDETSFLAGGFDPIIAGVEQSATDFNIDFGFSYQYLEFYAHASIKNLLNNETITIEQFNSGIDNIIVSSVDYQNVKELFKDSVISKEDYLKINQTNNSLIKDVRFSSKSNSLLLSPLYSIVL